MKNKFWRTSLVEIFDKIEQDERLIGQDKWLVFTFTSDSKPELNEVSAIIHVIDQTVVTIKLYADRDEFMRDNPKQSKMWS